MICLMVNDALRMKILILFAFIALAAAQEYYTTGNDHLDVDALLADRAKTKQFLDCYLDQGPCSELALSYKRIIPEAVAQACKKCNQDQKHIFWKFLKGIKDIFPEEYHSIRQKYDPDNIYFEALERELSKY